MTADLINFAITAALMILCVIGIKNIFNGVREFRRKNKVDRFREQVDHELARLYQEPSTYKDMHETIRPCFKADNSPSIVACAITMQRSG